MSRLRASGASAGQVRLAATLAALAAPLAALALLAGCVTAASPPPPATGSGGQVTTTPRDPGYPCEVC